MNKIVIMGIWLFAHANVVAAPPLVENGLSQYGILWNTPAEFAITKNDQKKSNDKTIHQLIFEGKNSRIELKIFGPVAQTQAEGLIQFEYSTFKKLYSSAVTPYFGAVTNKKSCPDNLNPKEESVHFLDKNNKAMFAKANSRYTFGVCAIDDALYDGTLIATYLPNGYFVKLAVFVGQVSKNKIDTTKQKNIIKQFRYKP